VSSMTAAIRLQSPMWRFRKIMDIKVLFLYIRVIRDIGDIVLLTIRSQTIKLSSQTFIVRLPDCRSRNADIMSECYIFNLLDCKSKTVRLPDCQTIRL
jgi:hypothetical protein